MNNRNTKRGARRQPYTNPNRKVADIKSGNQRDHSNQNIPSSIANIFKPPQNNLFAHTPSPPLQPSIFSTNNTLTQNAIEDKYKTPFSFSVTQTPTQTPTITPPPPLQITNTPQPQIGADSQPESTKGLCDKMCPDSFAAIIIKNCNKIFEVGPDGQPDRELFITNNPRCTSDRNNDPKDIRSEIGLKKAYDRIRDHIIPFDKDVENGALYQIYYYLKEILSSLVKDTKLTAHYSQLAIDILEFSIRFCT